LSNISKFAAYAAAFEKAYDDNEWDVLEAFFSEDVVYQVGLPLLGAERIEGRNALLDWFPDVLDRFDRKFASRELKLLDGPKEEGDEVWLRGAATYGAEGIPDFVLVLEETLRFENGRIVYLEDRYSAEMADQAAQFARDHGATLGLELTPD
jgi:hypothetical protein